MLNAARRLLPALCLLLLPLGARGQDQTGPRAPHSPSVPQGRGEFEIVLIHGLGGSAADWDEVAPYLKGTFNVFTFELAGHGNTQPVAEESVATEVKRLEAFIAENGVAYPTLVGHGLGGMIALQYALDHPADVHRLIVLDAAPRQMISQEEKGHIADLLVKDYDRFVASRYLNMSEIPAVTDRVVDTALRTDSASFIALLMSSMDFDLTSRLKNLSVPLLIIGSSYMFPEGANSQEILRHLGWANARSLTFKRIDHAGYFMMLDRPVYTASVVLAFGVTSDYNFGN